MGALFNTPQLPVVPSPPPPPLVSDKVIQQAASDTQARRGMAHGRASTLLTDTQTQRTTGTSQQRHLEDV
jgi:hypothetical protein